MRLTTTGTPTLRAMSSAFSVSTRTVPLPTTPRPRMPTLICVFSSGHCGSTKISGWPCWTSLPLSTGISVTRPATSDGTSL